MKPPMPSHSTNQRQLLMSKGIDSKSAQTPLHPLARRTPAEDADRNMVQATVAGLLLTFVAGGEDIFRDRVVTLLRAQRRWRGWALPTS